jgi:hypothetical protein
VIAALYFASSLVTFLSVALVVALYVRRPRPVPYLTACALGRIRCRNCGAHVVHADGCRSEARL